MSDILVLSSAYTSNPNDWAAFRLSCEKHKVPVHVVGPNSNEAYPGMEGIRKGSEFLKGRSEEYIVITDSFDVIVNRWDEDELRMMIDSAPNLIMSVEPLVWPAGCPDTYPSKERYKWRAINGGQYCGRRANVISMWTTMTRRWDAGQATRGGSSQEILHYMYEIVSDSQRWFPFTLDLECRLFQSMLGEESKYVQPRLGPIPGGAMEAYNVITKTFPMFLHFNGPAKGMQEWASLLI